MLNSINFGLQECECGVTINFPNPSGSLPRKDEYLLYFDLESSLPLDVPTNITISPDSYVLSGTNNFIPKTIVKVQSVFRGETQSLLKLSIKDKFNKTIYTDYLKVTCSPISKVTIKGNIKNAPDNLGPNGGTLMNVSSVAELDVGMSVSGQYINSATFISSIINTNQIELSRNLSISVLSQQFDYTFTRTTNCVDPTTLNTREDQTQNIVLDKNNNWTYLSNDKLIIQFVRSDIYDDTITVIVPAKNKTILPDSSVKSDIPLVSMVYASGRVNNDQYCIS